MIAGIMLVANMPISTLSATLPGQRTPFAWTNLSITFVFSVLQIVDTYRLTQPRLKEIVQIYRRIQVTKLRMLANKPTFIIN